MSAEKDNKDKQPWHLDRTVSLSHIITTASAIGAALVFASKLDTRVSLLEQSSAQQQRETADFKTVVREDLKNINGKLDRLIERGK
jgi:hypothetical protein